MEISNQSVISEFFLIGLTYVPDIESFIFSLFLSIYFVTIFGNILIILAVSLDYQLHTPMYFFIANLSFTDICISTTIIPKVLLNIETQNQSITYTGCLSQVCFVLIFGGLESCLLAVMAYDRYLAIVHPLRYTVIMNPCLCVLLVLLSLFISTMNALLHSLMLLKLSFCKDQNILHFFCELVQVIRHACSDTFVNTLLIYTVTSVFAGVPLAGIIFSYIQIVSSILKISSVKGRKKAFSTCGSHLSVVSLFYGTAFGVYMSSAVSDSYVKNIVFSMMYIVVPQMLNPFIYSLRNREMKQAMRHLLFSMFISSP
ncbi:olfactory receptor 7G1-like [Mastomys coucha]|uniref:olfactory receptor 7G1-like n=1 Tax=Mastomys coucha TaxID=35658 RepID=UPI001261A936|nr:olfactory receptor 7G1-like [Mastomys coucha]